MLSHMFQQIENLVEIGIGTGTGTGIGIGEETFLLGACFYNK